MRVLDELRIGTGVIGVVVGVFVVDVLGVTSRGLDIGIKEFVKSIGGGELAITVKVGVISNVGTGDSESDSESIKSNKPIGQLNTLANPPGLAE